MSFSENLRRIRKKKGLSQKDIADKLGVSQPSYAQYESGKRNPKIDTIIKIADALECSPADLEDKRLDLQISYNCDQNPVIVNGVISPEVTDINKMLEQIKESPFTVMTEGEKLIVYFNSLNDIGKNKVIEYMELLLSVSKYRNLEIELHDISDKKPKE